MKKDYQQPNIQTVGIHTLHVLTASDGLPSNKPNPGIQNNHSRRSGSSVWDDEDEDLDANGEFYN